MLEYSLVPSDDRRKIWVTLGGEGGVGGAAEGREGEGALKLRREAADLLEEAILPLAPRMLADREHALNAGLPERSLGVPVRLSYVGVPRRLAWGYGYGALCLVALGAGAVTYRADWMILAVLSALLVACSAHWLGCRVRVAVWPRAQGGYDVRVRRWGWTARYIAVTLPELCTSEPTRKQRARANPLATTQINLSLDLGSRLLVLPALPVGVNHADTQQRLEPFRLALRKLGPAEPSESEGDDSYDDAGEWLMPEFETSATQQVNCLVWAQGEGSALHLRHGVTLGQTAIATSVAVRFVAALGIVVLSVALPSSNALGARLQVVAAVCVVVLGLLAFASYAVRWQLQGEESAPLVVVEYCALGVACYTRRFPLAGGLRVLYAKETSQTSESTSTSLTAYLVTRSGQRHAVTGMSEEDDSARRLLANFSASLTSPRCVRTALRPSRQAAEPPRNYDEPPHSPGLGAPQPRSRLAELGVLVALLALLVALGSAAKQLLELQHANAWVQTSYRWETVRAGKSTRTLFHPALDPTVNLSPKPEEQRTDAPCWVIDDPHGHDIARYTPPTGPVTFPDKVRASLVLTCACWLAAATLAAGPFLRRRRSLDVRAG